MSSTINRNVPRVEGDASWIPEGYIVVTGPDDQRYVVPQYFVSALHQNLDGHREKDKLEIEKAAGTVLKNNSSTFGVIGEGMVMAPTAPGSSDRERLSAHAEILALQERFGISYKDASHRLYMAEMERLKADEKTYKAFATLQGTTKMALEKALKSLKDMENDGIEDIDTA